ncbi:unnamed protein product [Larinioides sclopetarius]|uniref:Uncharacterized protein n=1 Tax=Larinioides sclopetarius TaxID=280406 RepID=A0AAV2BXS1_9ARAC
MDLNDVSLSSVEDEKFSVTSIMEYESSHENRDIPVSNIKTSAPNNDQCLHRHDKTGQSSEVTKKPKIKDKSLRVQESSPSVSKIGEDSASNISVKVGNGNLKTSQTMLQFTDFEATCGSSSFNRMSSENKLSVDFQDNSEKCASSLEKPLLELPPTPVENTSISSFTISSDVGLNRESHSTNCIISGSEGSSLTEDCNEAISLDKNNRFNIPPQLPKGRLCNFHMAEKLRSILEISSTLASDGALHNEEMSSNKNTITALGKTYFLNTREDETLPYDCNGQNYCHKENKSVRRRKFKTEPPISETNSLPTRSSMPSVSNSSRKAGRSLLQLCKSLEETSPEEEDWDIYENYGRSGEVKYFTSKPWEKELLYFCYQMENAYAFPQMGTERLLKEVNNFFRNNHVDADENLNWKEMKNRIVTSKYFSGVQWLRKLSYSN